MRRWELRRGLVAPARRMLAQGELTERRFELLRPPPRALAWVLAWTGRER